MLIYLLCTLNEIVEKNCIIPFSIWGKWILMSSSSTGSRQSQKLEQLQSDINWSDIAFCVCMRERGDTIYASSDGSYDLEHAELFLCSKFWLMDESTRETSKRNCGLRENEIEPECKRCSVLTRERYSALQVQRCCAAVNSGKANK